MIKTFQIFSIAFLLVLASVSCKSKQDPTEFKPKDLVGTWKCTDDGLTDDSFTISEGGKIIIYGITFDINNWDSDKNNSVSQYKLDFDAKNQLYGVLTFTFKSSSECNVTSSVQSGTQHFKK